MAESSVESEASPPAPFGGNCPEPARLPWPFWAAAGLVVALLLASVWLRCRPQWLCFFVKMSVYYTWIMLLSVVACVLCAGRGRDVDNFRTVKALVRHLQRLYGVRVRVENAHHLLTTSSPYVIVSNHQSSIDFIALMECLPERCAPIAKRELLFVGPFGMIAWLCGVVFIDRQRTQHAKLTMSGVAAVMRERAINVWIFPEGTRSHGAPTLPFKKGAFHLAVQAQAPIIPIVFSSYNSFYSRQERRFNPGVVVATVLSPIYTEGFAPESVPELTGRIRDSMISVFHASSSTSSTSSTASTASTTSSPKPEELDKKTH